MSTILFLKLTACLFPLILKTERLDAPRKANNKISPIIINRKIIEIDDNLTDLLIWSVSEAINKAIDQSPDIPKMLKNIFEKKEKMTILENDTNLIKSKIMELV